MQKEKLNRIWQAYEKGFTSLSLPVVGVRVTDSVKHYEDIEFNGQTVKFVHYTFACIITDITENQLEDVAEALGKDAALTINSSILNYRNENPDSELVLCKRTKPEIDMQRVTSFIMSMQQPGYEENSLYNLRSRLRFSISPDKPEPFLTLHKLTEPGSELTKYNIFNDNGTIRDLLDREISPDFEQYDFPSLK